MTIRTRFAPSPTGYLHIGGARTALFNWAYARHHQGEFLLRIEDTDKTRSDPSMTQAIIDSLRWLQLTPDHDPVYQSQRFARYKAVLNQLLQQGDAYYCHCSPQRLDDLRQQQRARQEKPRYDGHCRSLQLGPDHPHAVVRFRQPQTGTVEFFDHCHGAISVANSELDDLILWRSDDSPTYNFCVVIDDMDMAITDVIRGDDHLNNTPRQINILRVLQAPVPRYTHVPMILGADGKRLSKRHGAVSVLHYREQGFLPEALLNYLVRLGWSHGDEEIVSLQQLSAMFTLSGLNKAAASVNPEKLLWLNQHYLKSQSLAALKTEVQFQLSVQGITPPDRLDDIINVQQARVKTVRELVQQSQFCWQVVSDYNPKAVKKHLKPASLPALVMLIEHLGGCDVWEPDELNTILQTVATECHLKFPKLAQPVRIALTGNTVSPGINDTLWLLGKTESLSRLQALQQYWQALPV